MIELIEGFEHLRISEILSSNTVLNNGIIVKGITEESLWGEHDTESEDE